MEPLEFPKFGKMPRWWKSFTITEKIDGTNGVIRVWDRETVPFGAPVIAIYHDEFPEARYVAAGSRNRWITPDADNHGFARWVSAHAEDAARLGPGVHYGEWYGSGVNRNYGLAQGEKRFALFNTYRWTEARPASFGVVPILWQGSGDDLSDGIEYSTNLLRNKGSLIAPGFMQPEGIVIHSDENHVFWKKYLDNDRNPKG